MTVPSFELAATIVDELARCGLEHACLSPGSRSGPVAVALALEDRIRVHVLLDERSAAFCALGIATATRRPAAVLSTSGTAAANFHPAVVEASLGRVPLIVLTADRPPELRGTGANQTADQLKLYGDAVRWFCEVGAPGASAGRGRYWRSVADRAWAEAAGARPGPVHVNVALSEPLLPDPGAGLTLRPAPGRAGRRPWTEARPAPRRALPGDIAALAQRIAATERGAVVAGAAADAFEPVVALAERTGWPVLAEPASGLRFGPNAVSTYEALLRAPAFGSVHRPDLVIRTGKIGISRVVEAWLAPDVPQILLDADGEWLDPGRSLEEIVAADPAATAVEIGAAIPARGPGPWLRSWLDADAAARTAIDAVLERDDSVSEPRCARDLAAALPDGTNLVVAASMPVRDLDWFMAARPGIRVVANRGANGIDGFVSTALGVALGSGAPTAALCGDLAFVHDCNGLQLARAVTAGCAFVVVNNDGGGIFSFLPQASFPDVFEPLFGTPHGIDPAGLASAHGIPHELAERAGDVPRAVVAALERSGVTVIEVRTERRANVELHDALWDAVASALEPGSGSRM